MTINELLKKKFFQPLDNRKIEKNYDISKNVNSTICAECGGTCCKSCGCHFSPSDFEDLSFDGLKKELQKGYISIDYVDGELIYSIIGIYILRIRNQGSPIVDVGFRKKTPCILLAEHGCKLDYEHRPTGGKLLIPSTISSFCHEMSCVSNYDISDCCFEWRPYQKILRELVKYFENQDIPSSL